MPKITLEKGSWGDYTAYVDGVEVPREKGSIKLDRADSLEAVVRPQAQVFLLAKLPRFRQCLDRLIDGTGPHRLQIRHPEKPQLLHHGTSHTAHLTCLGYPNQGGLGK